MFLNPMRVVRSQARNSVKEKAVVRRLHLLKSKLCSVIPRPQLRKQKGCSAEAAFYCNQSV